MIHDVVDAGPAATLTTAPVPPALRPRQFLADRVRRAVLALAGGQGEVLSHEELAWASITFTGTRHEMVIRFEGTDAVEAGEGLIEQLPEYEFAIAGQLVAEAAVIATDHRFGVGETLTVTAVLLILEDC